MKNRALQNTLLITAGLSSLAVLLKFSFSEIFGNIICFPLEQIGMGLRWLSLKGGLHNGIAIILYVAICLAPFFVLLLLKKKKIAKAEDNLMFLLTVVLFYVIYMMINPSLIPLHSGLALGADMGKALLSGAVYSVIVAYVVLRGIRFFVESETKKLYQYMVALLWLSAILFTISIFGVGLNHAVAAIKSIGTANEGTESGLGITYVFTAMKFIVSSVPNAVSILVIFSGITLITEFSVDPYSEDAIQVSKNLSAVCKTGLIVTVCSNAAFNILQLLFMQSLRNINSLIQIPLVFLVFVLGALIFSRMVLANKTLKDENDSII